MQRECAFDVRPSLVCEGSFIFEILFLSRKSTSRNQLNWVLPSNFQVPWFPCFHVMCKKIFQCWNISDKPNLPVSFCLSSRTSNKQRYKNPLLRMYWAMWKTEPIICLSQDIECFILVKLNSKCNWKRWMLDDLQKIWPKKINWCTHQIAHAWSK